MKKITPKNKEHLIKIIEQEIKKQGHKCNLNHIDVIDFIFLLKSKNIYNNDTFTNSDILSQSIYNYIVNADIKNISQNLVAAENKELIENNSRAKLYIGQKLLSNIELTIQGVRVSFDVVPKNGSKPVHIVKVFQADIETSK